MTAPSRILFVDDETRVLDGLRLSLRSQRKVWDMVFLDGGEAALKEVERSPYDVIVSDMRMPGLDGAEFLRRAALIRPDAARIVLSGQMEDAAAMRAATTAHRFLAKPCDRSVLVSSIERALELRMILADDRIRSTIGGIDRLPSLPKVYRALSDALANAEASVREIAEVIEDDVALSAKVLQLVNSGFFGVPRQVTNIAHAVRYLGINTLRTLVLSHSVFEQLPCKNQALLEREQQHAMQCARMARQFLPEGAAADVAFTGGMLHDVGALVLACRLPDDYESIRLEAARDRVPIAVVEHRRLGVTHAQVGAYLLGLWDLPHDLLDIVVHHHDALPDAASVSPLIAVRLADELSTDLLGESAGEPIHGDPLPPELVTKLGLDGLVRKLRAKEARHDP